jgi:oxygen-dependent protoporphyrinogen oxidase
MDGEEEEEEEAPWKPDPADDEGGTPEEPMPPVADAIVVGAGLAGMTCAIELQRAGRSVLLLERGPRAGGRLCTGELDGTTIDLGAHFLSPRYATVLRLVREAGLEHRLRPLADSYRTGIWHGGRWHYLDYGRPVGVIGYSALPLAQKLRLARIAIPLARSHGELRFFDLASAAAVDGLSPARLFGELALLRVFAPASQAYCGYRPGDISLPLLLLGARFPLRSPLTLEGGLGQLGPALARRLRVRYDTHAEQLSLDARGSVCVHARGSDRRALRFRARAAVIATTPSAALRLWPSVPPAEREFLASARYTQHFHAYLRTSPRFKPPAPGGRSLHMEILPSHERDGLLSHLSFPRVGGGTPGGGGLVFLAAHSHAARAHHEDGELADRLQAEAELLHPELRGQVGERRTIRWREKVPLFPRGRARELAALRSSMRPGPIQLAGDYLYGPLLEGAALSGVAAAERIEAYLERGER